MISHQTAVSVQIDQIVLLIDADNVAAQQIDEVIRILAVQGTLVVRRAYGNWQKPHLQGWQDVILRHALQPMQQFDYCKSKNATDMALTIDAMDLLYSSQITLFAIVSSDCDFTPLVLRLKRAGKRVLGFGKNNASSALIKAYDEFYPLCQTTGDDNKLASPVIENVDLSLPSVVKTKSLTADSLMQPPQANDDVAAKTAVLLKGDTRLINAIRQAIAECQNAQGWASVSGVGSKLSQARISSKDYGFKTLTKLLAAIDLFELCQQGTHYLVKDKR